jgi:gamma-glutamylcyclotransferase (GGCT)/AIG2-like uncharacterized protein YtfP
MLKVYQRKCLVCKDKFTPKNNTQIVCSPSCSLEYLKKQRSKEWKEQKKVIKQSLETKSEVLKAAQIVFNTYIRLRDKDKPCISCDKPYREKDINASHFYSVGAYPNLRFNEDNVHNSCIRCNKDLHGNINEYTLRLPNRIGVERYNLLVASRNKPLKLALDEVKELIYIYKEKIKELKNG